MTQKEKELKKIQWTGDNLKEVIEFTGRSPKFDEWFKTWEEYEEYVRSHGNIFKIFFENGSHYEVPVGSWIIKTPDGINIPYTVTIGNLVGWEDENRLLLLKDLCARLPYGVRVKISDKDILLVENNEKGTLDGKETISDDNFVIKCDKNSWIISCDGFKPYLRPMSSMTEEECKELGDLPATFEGIGEVIPNVPYYIEVTRPEQIDWLNAHHFDYRGLIEKGLALEAPEDMYKTK